MEKGHLLEIHLLKKTARHQNLDCSTLFEQMTKIYESARKSKSIPYMSCRADASFRPKCTTARIATARQKH